MPHPLLLRSARADRIRRGIVHPVAEAAATANQCQPQADSPDCWVQLGRCFLQQHGLWPAIHTTDFSERVNGLWHLVFRTVTLEIPGLAPTHCYELKIGGRTPPGPFTRRG